MRLLLTASALALLAACSEPAGDTASAPEAPAAEAASASPAPELGMASDEIAAAAAEEAAADRAAAAAPPITAPAGTYTLDPTHASLLFRVNHLGFSNYTARFTKFGATLQFDPANPTAMSVTATVDPASLETDFPLAEPDFDAELSGPQWLDAAQYPEITFTSTAIEMMGERSARVTGDFTMKGVRKPVSLDATFNGGYPGAAPYDPAARIGFSAHGTLNRSDYGISFGIPAPGTMFGVSDAVEFILEVEFVGPPLTADAAPGAQ